jgi:hypothetical protein
MTHLKILSLPLSAVVEEHVCIDIGLDSPLLTENRWLYMIHTHRRAIPEGTVSL